VLARPWLSIRDVSPLSVLIRFRVGKAMAEPSR
jgi:hypothetical protein